MSYCAECGTDHHAGERDNSGRSAEVRIAEINAKRDVEVARIQRGEARAVTETEAETAVAVTELETVAAVAVAEATDPPEPDSSEDGNQAIIVEGPPAEPAEDAEPDALAPKEEHLPDPAAKTSRGYWG